MGHNVVCNSTEHCSELHPLEEGGEEEGSSPSSHTEALIRDGPLRHTSHPSDADEEPTYVSPTFMHRQTYFSQSEQHNSVCQALCRAGRGGETTPRIKCIIGKGDREGEEEEGKKCIKRQSI